MKLVRFGAPGREKPGIIDDKGRIRDLSKIVPDIAGDALSPKSLNKIRKTDLSTLPAVKAGTRLGPCVGDTRHFIAIGLNYADHAAETGAQIPKEPIIFQKAPTCIVGPNDDTMIPKGSTKLDYECEIAIVIGSRARYLSKKDALDVVAGYTICNDVSERNFQAERGGQWTKGKSADTFCPMGPWLVTADEVPDPGALPLWTEVNGERRQNSNTSDLIFGIDHIVSYVSHFMTLMPGDVIPTGTTSGVGLGFKPPRFLKPGDRMRLSVEGLGVQEQRLVAFEG